MSGHASLTAAVGNGTWEPVRLEHDANPSGYHCSAYSFAGKSDGDFTDVGC